MFPIFRPRELAYHLGATVADLKRVLQSPKEYYDEFELHDPKKPNKIRPVLAAKRPLSTWQSRFYRNVLLCSLDRSEYSHGGRPGHSIKTNLRPHLKSGFIYKADISDFYPRIHDEKVYRLFAEHFGCSPEVANLCCRLCTYKHHLALGLATSPIIADHLLRIVDARIGAACRKRGWVYTRYVDDITISAPHDLEHSGIASLIGRILLRHGFRAKKDKSEAKSVDKITITGLRIVDGRMDVEKAYAVELDRQLDDALALTHNLHFDGPYFTHGQLAGRVRFVSWINPGRARLLKIKLAKLSRRKMVLHAAERKLIQCKKRLVRPGSFAARSR